MFFYLKRKLFYKISFIWALLIAPLMILVVWINEGAVRSLYLDDLGGAVPDIVRLNESTIIKLRETSKCLLTDIDSVLGLNIFKDFSDKIVNFVLRFFIFWLIVAFLFVFPNYFIIFVMISQDEAIVNFSICIFGRTYDFINQYAGMVGI